MWKESPRPWWTTVRTLASSLRQFWEENGPIVSFGFGGPLFCCVKNSHRGSKERHKQSN